MTAFRRLYRVNVADDVGDGDIGRGEFFDETRIAFNPSDGRVIACGFDYLTTKRADRMKRIIVDFRTGDDRNALVQKTCQLSYDAAFRLTAQTQKNEIMPG